jgi:hypothetical protein
MNTNKSLLTNGIFNFGKYKFPLNDIDFLKSKKPFGTFSPKFYKNFRLKEWQAFQAGNEKFFILIAIYNAKTLGLVRFILFDKTNNKKYFYEKKVFPSSLKIPKSVFEGTAEYFSKNYMIKTFYDSVTKEIKIDIEIKNFQKLPDLKFNFNGDYNPEKHESISACIPFGENRGMYSHKVLCNAEGEISINNEKFSFNKSDSFLILDDHKGFYPNPMIYDWITGAKTISGISTGFNLTDNQSTDPDNFNENCIWENGKTHFLGSVAFKRPDGVNGKWYIKDEAGNVNLCFTPIDQNPLYLNFLIIKAEYEGPLGYISGTIKTPEKIFEINEYFGMGEKKYIKG